MNLLQCLVSLVDHCRIGSLENVMNLEAQYKKDHCRIGSLEMDYYPDNRLVGDHCRIGSLEISYRSAQG